MGADEEVLPWSRAEQAAFLLLVWQQVERAVTNCESTWTKWLRETEEEGEARRDLAFAGPHTLLNTDQGVRGVLYVTNDLCYIQAKDLALVEWGSSEDAAASDEAAVTRALESLDTQNRIVEFLQKIADSLAKYDWRTASAPGLPDDEKTLKLAFRGSGGYKELRRQLLHHLSDEPGDVGRASRAVLKALGYD